jgi:2-dehydro-3-deoxyphosphogluconate aldolase/(4S)-4-hydroxy-2-oxoglutarate aldolase
MNRVDPSPVMRGNPVIAVLRARHARDYPPVIDALIAGGVHAIELTLSTDGVFDELPQLVDRFGEHAAIGIGTVTAVGEAEAAISGGADFLVTPTTDVGVVRVACDSNVPVFPGGLTPTELHAGWSAGASAVKLFPASAVGPDYIGQLHGPFPNMDVIPSGGVGIDDAAAWIAAGAVAVSLGGPLLGDVFRGGDPAELTRRAQLLTELVADAVEGRKAKR